MKPVECEFEADVLSAVVQSRWPDRVDPELRAHAANCAICSDVAAIAYAIEAERDTVRAAATVPDAGRVWWLSRLRAKREAVETARHAITATQLVSLTCIVALLGACFGATSQWFQSALQSLILTLGAVDWRVTLAEHSLAAIGIATLVLLVPAVIYWALTED